MAAGQAEARDALYAHILEALEEAKESLNADRRATAIKELAAAYRFVYGGTQPGSAVVTS